MSKNIRLDNLFISLSYSFKTAEKKGGLIKDIVDLHKKNSNGDLIVCYSAPFGTDILKIAQTIVALAKKHKTKVFCRSTCCYNLTAGPLDNPEKVVQRFLRSIFEKYSASKVKRLYVCSSGTNHNEFFSAMGGISKLLKRSVKGQWENRIIKVNPTDTLKMVKRKFSKAPIL